MVGGGPAGAATAIALSELGVPSVVLEAAPGPQHKVGESIPPSANPVLARLGLSAGLARAALPAYGNRSFWGAAEAVDADYVFGTTGTGWRVDRQRFEADLAATATTAGVDWRYGCRLVGCTRREPRGWMLQVISSAGRQALAADVVVDASGRAARVARLLGVRRIRYDRLVGAVAYGSTGEGSDGVDADSTTLVEAVPDGWWYSMHLPAGRIVTAFMTDADLLTATGARTAEGWGALLDSAPATRNRVRAAAGDGPWDGPHVWGAHTSRLTAVVGPDWLAVGDAAVTYDPLTSYGMAAALGQGVYAAAAVVEHLAGRREALPDHARLIDGAFARYLILLHDRYAGEQRWPDAVFWQRRQRHRSPGEPASP